VAKIISVVASLMEQLFYGYRAVLKTVRASSIFHEYMKDVKCPT